MGHRFLAVALVGLVAIACDRQPAEQPTVFVGVSGHINEHVSATSDGAFVALTWAASSESTGTNIYASISVDGGGSFSPPVRVNTVDRQANVNGEQPPRVAIVRERDGRRSIVVLWTAKGAAGTMLLSARSGDDGRTFGPATEWPGLDAPGNRGWESMAATGDGQVYALWLDHRDAAAGAGHAGHHPHGTNPSARLDGVARAQRSQLFVGTLDGRLPPASIARGVCYCCKTAVTTDPHGAVYAAWRHVYEGNRRDIAFTMSRDGGRSFAPPLRVSEDEWQLDGCPENGPAIAVDGDGRIHVVWPTLVQKAGGETLALFHASSQDGRTFTPRAALPTNGAASHPQLIVASDGALVVAWDELRSGERRVKAARGARAADGGYTFSTIADTVERAGAYPALATAGRSVLMAWSGRGEAASTIAVERVD